MPLETWQEQLRRGSLDLAILLTVSAGPRYGLAIIQHLEAFTDLVITEGTIYPILGRLTRDGLLAAEWVEGEAPHARKYYRLTRTGVKRLSKNWMLRASVGWSSFRQHLEPESIQNPNNLWNWGGQNDGGGLASAVSPKDNVWLNAGWQFNLNGLYQGPWGLTLGTNLYGRQGNPRPYKVDVVTHDVAGSEWSLLIDAMDTYRYPNVYQLDLRLQKTLQIGPITVTPAIELFNAVNSNTLLNSAPLTGTYDVGQYRPKAFGIFEPDDFFDDIIEIQSPRIVRLGIQVSF